MRNHARVVIINVFAVGYSQNQREPLATLSSQHYVSLPSVDEEVKRIKKWV